MKHDLLEQLGAALVAPSEPTCFSGTGAPTCLDWWLIGPDLAARCPSAGTWQETALPTHRPVELSITGKQRPLTLTALRRPAALPPPGEPQTEEDKATRETVTQRLAASLDQCLLTLRTPPPPTTPDELTGDPTAATSSALRLRAVALGGSRQQG